jgi:hypothetical protein
MELDLDSGISNPVLVFGMQKITTTSYEIPALNIAMAFTSSKYIFGQQKITMTLCKITAWRWI